METKNAVITGAHLTCAERGLLTCWIVLDYCGCGQQFGGYALYLPKSFKHHELKSVAGHWIFRCMEIAGVENWKDIVGKTIRVKCEWDKVQAIGHILKEDWFDPAEDFKTEK